MTTPLTACERFLHDHQVQNGTLLIGVSGGADSVALLRVLQTLASQRHLRLVVAHYDHALREDSAADARWVEELCRQFGLACRSERRQGGSGENSSLSEENARQQRYDFLVKVADEEGCRWVAVAHHADDQVETLLHHIVRGSGLKGLTGIPAIRALDHSDQTGPCLLIRPLLQISRSEIETYLKSLSQTCRNDPTNAECDFTRNQLRNVILPLLRQELNPRIDHALLQLAQQAADAQTIISEVVHQLLEKAVLDQQVDSVRLQRALLATQSRGLLRSLFAHLWEVQRWPRQHLGFDHLDGLAQMALSPLPDKRSLPGKIQAIAREHLFELRRLP